MKKIVILSSLILGTIFLAGCGQQSENQTQSTTPSPVVQQTQTATPNKTIDWQTYTNNKYGFSFQHPDEFKIRENDFEKEPAPGGIIFVLDVSDNILISVAKIGKDLAKDFDLLAAPNGMDPASQKDVVIEGQKARIYNDGEVYVVAKNGYTYYLQIIDTEKLGRDTLSKIVDTFKFTK
jgi:hypothetical protein